MDAEPLVRGTGRPFGVTADRRSGTGGMSRWGTARPETGGLCGRRLWGWVSPAAAGAIRSPAIAPGFFLSAARRPRPARCAARRPPAAPPADRPLRRPPTARCAARRPGATCGSASRPAQDADAQHAGSTPGRLERGRSAPRPGQPAVGSTWARSGPGRVSGRWWSGWCGPPSPPPGAPGPVPPPGAAPPPPRPPPRRSASAPPRTPAGSPRPGPAPGRTPPGT